MNRQTLVSIVIPVYNGSDYLAQAIESALAQTWPAVEVLVVNDGSADGGATRGVAAGFGERIRYIEKANGGVSSALNAGIREMRGEWFCWLSHDDVYLPRRVEAAMDWLSRHVECVAAYSGYRLVGASLRPIFDPPCPWYPRKKALLTMMGGHYIGGCTMTIERSLFERLGFFDESLRLAQDLDMWLRIMVQHEIGRVPEILVLTRVHELQGSTVENDGMVSQGIDVYRQHLERFGLPGVCPPLSDGAGPRDRSRALLHVADNLLRHQGNEDAAVRLYEEAAVSWPSPLNPAWTRRLRAVRQLIAAEGNWHVLLGRSAPWLVSAIRRLG